MVLERNKYGTANRAVEAKQEQAAGRNQAAIQNRKAGYKQEPEPAGPQRQWKSAAYSGNREEHEHLRATGNTAEDDIIGSRDGDHIERERQGRWEHQEKRNRMSNSTAQNWKGTVTAHVPNREVDVSDR